LKVLQKQNWHCPREAASDAGDYIALTKNKTSKK